MNSILIFVGGILALVLLALIFNKIKGVRGRYTDQLELAPGEQISREDDAADFHVVPKFGQAAIMSFGRLKRTHAIVTNRRIVIGQKPLFSKRHLITHMLYFSAEPEVETALGGLTGGLYSLGYTVLQVDRDRILSEMDGKKPYWKIPPSPTTSATNIEHARLYSEQAREAL